jgi:colanic acid/amylovoran biosynthesis glycosyltransferase
MRNFIVYRDRLFAKSEQAFLRRQYVAFSQLKPIWVGCRLQSAPHPSDTAFVLGGKGIWGSVQRSMFKQWGRVPDANYLRSISPLLIHAQFGKGGAFALPMAKALGVPLVVTFHGGDAFKSKHFESALLPTAFQRRWDELQRYASLFICVSEGVRSKLIERGVQPEKLEVIHIGVEPYTGPAATEFRRHFLFAGRFVEKKGVFVLLDAIGQLRAQGIKTPFVLAGDGPLLAEAKKRAAALDDVAFAGWMSPAALKEAMAQSIAIVVPSIRGADGDAEGLVTVAVEAMSMGVPAVASDSAGLSSLLRAAPTAGVIVPSGSPRALTEALALLATQPNRSVAMGAAAAALARAQLCANKQSAYLEGRLLSVAGQ